MLTIKSKTQIDSDNGVDKFYFELNATSVSDLPSSGKINGQDIADGSPVLITGSVDTGAFYVFDEENTAWNKVGGE